MRDARAVDVGIHEADFGAAVFEAIGQRSGDRAFANAAFTGTDGDHAFGCEADFADGFGGTDKLNDADADMGVWRKFVAEQTLGFDAGFFPEQAGPGRKAKRYFNAAAIDRDMPNLLHPRKVAAGFR